MGRQRFNKREHIEKSNLIFENKYLLSKGLLKEQLGTNSYGCDLSCIDISDPATDNMVAQGGGPNNIQPYDPPTAYAPGSVVCNLDPTLGVTNIFVASANSGQLVTGGGQYPEPIQGFTAFFYPPPNSNYSDYFWEPGVITMACGGNSTSGTTSGTTNTQACFGCVNGSIVDSSTNGLYYTPSSNGWCSTFMGNDYYSSVSNPALSGCGANTGDWWCDPTGQYVNSTGGNCIQSPNQPQSYFTGPYSNQQTCEAQCSGGTANGAGCLDPNAPNFDPNAVLDCIGNPQGAIGYGDTSCCGGGQGQNTCMDIQTEVCDNPGMGGQWPCATIDGVVPDQTYIGKVIDAGSTNSSTGAPIYFEITNINPSTSAPFGTQDFPEVTAGCPGSTNNPSNCDFSWTSSCAQTHLQTGGQSSWMSFLTSRETSFNTNGCQHLQSVVNWNTNQLNSGVTGSGAPLSTVQISRKNEMISWAQCQASECTCSPLNIPALTGGPTPTSTMEWCCGGGITGVGQCIEVPVGTCNQQSMGTGYSGGPYADEGDCQMSGCGSPTPPNNPDLIDPEAPIKPMKERYNTPTKIPRLGDVKTLNEERERMKQMWKHKL